MLSMSDVCLSPPPMQESYGHATNLKQHTRSTRMYTHYWVDHDDEGTSPCGSGSLVGGTVGRGSSWYVRAAQ
jgi:hypothetical protein